MATRRQRSPSGVSVRRTEWKAIPVDNRPEVDLLSWVGWIIGGELAVVGLVALARAGFNGFDLFEPAVAVGPYTLTRLAALLSIALGLIVWYGAVGVADDLGLRVLGAIMLVVGIVFTIEPGGFAQWLGTGREDGLRFIGLGGALVLFSLIPPFKVGKAPRAEADPDDTAASR